MIFYIIYHPKKKETSRVCDTSGKLEFMIMNEDRFNVHGCSFIDYVQLEAALWTLEEPKNS